MTMLYLLALLVVLGVAGWIAWQYLGRAGGALFGGGRDSRIGVSEITSIDGKRKLMLIHRDGVEHLVMTGGPIDIVIEQGIQPPRRPTAAAAMAPVPSYEPRLSPQAVNMPLDGNQEPPPGFGRLRQRGAPGPVSDQRVEPGTGSGHRS